MQPRPVAPAVALLATLAFAPGCEPNVPSRATVVGDDGVRAPSIVNGTVYNGRAAVGRLDIQDAQGGGLCTATLIGSRTVLTAAHCVEGATSITFVVGGQSYPSASATKYPTWTEQTNIGVDDLAIVRLQSAPSVAPAAVAQTPPPVGADVVLVGYGLTSKSANDAGVRRGATASVGAVEAKRIALFDATRGMSCNGDSGGPMLAPINGKEYVVGVVSGSTVEACNVDSYYARVDAYLTWIQSTAQNDVNLTGTTPEAPPQTAAPSQPSYPSPPNQPSYPPPPNQPSYPSQPGQPSYPGSGGFGSPCQGAQDCQSGVCVSSPYGAAVCSTLCNSAQDCQGATCLPTQQGVGVCDAFSGGNGGTPSQPSYPSYPSYPSQPGQPPTPGQPGGNGGAIGAPCQSSQQCGSGGVCVDGGYGSGICTIMCSYGGFGCPWGMLCTPTNVPSLSVCM